MPQTYSYPGVYVEEIPSGVRTIVGVSTSDTAFVDYFARGPVQEATRVTSFDDFQRKFGGLDTSSEASYAIQQYYLNGGQIAWVVRVTTGDAQAAKLALTTGSPPRDAIIVRAANPGEWGRNLEVAVTQAPVTSPPDGRFNLFIRERVLQGGRLQVVNTESYRNLNMTEGSARYAISVVNDASELVRLTDAGLEEDSPPALRNLLPTPGSATPSGDPQEGAYQRLQGGRNGDPPTGEALTSGMRALEKIAPFVFNILCLPAAANLNDVAMQGVISSAEAFCEDKRAFLIVDIPQSVDDVVTWMGQHDGLRHRNAAVYFPRLRIPDRLNEDRLRDVGPSGTLAGVYARTDSTRGVWKAPAGTDASLQGATLVRQLTDLENGGLNPLGINALRTFPLFGNIGWGARTLEGADQQASEWKYIPVRRTALYVEESLYQGLKWVVFEPNDEPLWAQIRLNVGAFMQSLFRQGAFQGTTPRDAYFVKCDKETTTQNDIDRGIVNILVGFAPLKPAEFVVIKIQLMAGQIQT